MRNTQSLYDSQNLDCLFVCCEVRWPEKTHEPVLYPKVQTSLIYSLWWRHSFWPMLILYSRFTSWTNLYKSSLTFAQVQQVNNAVFIVKVCHFDYYDAEPSSPYCVWLSNMRTKKYKRAKLRCKRAGGLLAEFPSLSSAKTFESYIQPSRRRHFWGYVGLRKGNNLLLRTTTTAHWVHTIWVCSLEPEGSRVHFFG